MPAICLICPRCSSSLRVSDQLLGRKGRCPSCQEVFVMTRGLVREDGCANDDDVVSWLGGSVRSENAPPPPPPARRPPEFRRPAARAEAPQAPPPPPAESEAGRFNIRLDHVDNMGAFFLFDSRLLLDDDFRASFPQRCILCGSKGDLSIYPILWSCKLEGKSHNKSPVDFAPYVARLSGLEGRTGRELLAQLRPVDCLPSPYNQPFPYYVCSACSPVGAVMTHVHTKYDKGQQAAVQETCELGISSLAQAERFAARVCGPETDAVKRIRRARQECVADAWRALPLAVRNRISLWYQPQEAEAFVGYINDADFAKAEAGSAGIVVTDRRLVWRKSVAQAQIDRGQHIRIEEQPRDGRLILHIRGADGTEARLAANPECVETIRKMVMQPTTAAARSRQVIG